MARPLVICGATATGKTALSLMLARERDGEIVGCDSMQIYRGLDIGTAKPTPGERARIRHHMIDIKEPTEPYSVSQYKDDAERAMEDIVSRGKTPVLCGGTGLYLDALIYDNKYSDEDSGDEKIRLELMRFAEENGAEALHAKLRDIDPESAEATHPNNVRRVIRAIEIFEKTGRRKSEWDAESRTGVRRAMTVIGLRFDDRGLHRDAIRRRCREMMEDGLPDEAARLYSSGALKDGMPASRAIAYKELIPFLRGEESMYDAEMRLYYATCRYAKRQATWFYKKDYINWLSVDAVCLGNEGIDDLFGRAMKIISLGED